jgi:hypothetical protein
MTTIRFHRDSLEHALLRKLWSIANLAVEEHETSTAALQVEPAEDRVNLGGAFFQFGLEQRHLETTTDLDALHAVFDEAASARLLALPNRFCIWLVIKEAAGLSYQEGSFLPLESKIVEEALVSVRHSLRRDGPVVPAFLIEKAQTNIESLTPRETAHLLLAHVILIDGPKLIVNPLFAG